MSNLTDEQIEQIESYVKAHWSDSESLDDLSIFLDEGYLQLVIHRLIGAGAIQDPEMSLEPETEKLCLKYVEGYTFENDEKDTDECMSSVNPEILVHPETNETKFIPSDIDYVTQDFLDEGFVSEGRWNDSKPKPEKLSYSERKTLAKYAELIKEKSLWTKQEINGFKKLINSAMYLPEGLKVEVVIDLWEKFCSRKEPIQITDEQSIFGIRWLINKAFRLNGEPRQTQEIQDVFGFHQFEIIKNFSHFTFVGYDCDWHNYSGRVQVINPVYRVHSKNGDYFDYSFGHWGKIVTDIRLNQF